MDVIDQFIPIEYQNTKITTLEDILGVGLNILLGAAMTASIIGLIMSGIKYMSTRSGDPRKLEEAKKALTFSLVAMILSVGAFTILNIILNTLGGSPADVYRG